MVLGWSGARGGQQGVRRERLKITKVLKFSRDQDSAKGQIAFVKFVYDEASKIFS